MKIRNPEHINDGSEHCDCQNVLPEVNPGCFHLIDSKYEHQIGVLQNHKDDKRPENKC